MEETEVVAKPLPKPTKKDSPAKEVEPEEGA
jgi:hypothetical protein